MSKGLFGLGCVLFLVCVGARCYADIQFSRYCSDHLKRAADANTVQIAEQEVTTAIAYLDHENIRTGYTSVLYNTPDEDIGFWYRNLVAARNELRGVSPTATQLERTNVLMKLRETLLDNAQNGVRVTVPSGVSIYPHNRLYAFPTFVSFALMLMSFAGLFKAILKDFGILSPSNSLYRR